MPKTGAYKRESAGRERARAGEESFRLANVYIIQIIRMISINNLSICIIFHSDFDSQFLSPITLFIIIILSLLPFISLLFRIRLRLRSGSDWGLGAIHENAFAAIEPSNGARIGNQKLCQAFRLLHFLPQFLFFVFFT